MVWNGRRYLCLRSTPTVGGSFSSIIVTPVTLPVLVYFIYYPNFGSLVLCVLSGVILTHNLTSIEEVLRPYVDPFLPSHFLRPELFWNLSYSRYTYLFPLLLRSTPIVTITSQSPTTLPTLQKHLTASV